MGCAQQKHLACLCWQACASTHYLGMEIIRGDEPELSDFGEFKLFWFLALMAAQSTFLLGCASLQAALVPWLMLSFFQVATCAEQIFRAPLAVVKPASSRLASCLCWSWRCRRCPQGRRVRPQSRGSHRNPPLEPRSGERRLPR